MFNPVRFRLFVALLSSLCRTIRSQSRSPPFCLVCCFHRLPGFRLPILNFRLGAQRFQSPLGPWHRYQRGPAGRRRPANILCFAQFKVVLPMASSAPAVHAGPAWRGCAAPPAACSAPQCSYQLLPPRAGRRARRTPRARLCVFEDLRVSARARARGLPQLRRRALGAAQLWTASSRPGYGAAAAAAAAAAPRAPHCVSRAACPALRRSASVIAGCCVGGCRMRWPRAAAEAARAQGRVRGAAPVSCSRHSVCLTLHACHSPLCHCCLVLRFCRPLPSSFVLFRLERLKPRRGGWTGASATCAPAPAAVCHGGRPPAAPPGAGRLPGLRSCCSVSCHSMSGCSFASFSQFFLSTFFSFFLRL